MLITMDLTIVTHAVNSSLYEDLDFLMRTINFFRLMASQKKKNMEENNLILGVSPFPYIVENSQSSTTSPQPLHGFCKGNSEVTSLA